VNVVTYDCDCNKGITNPNGVFSGVTRYNWWSELVKCPQTLYNMIMNNEFKHLREIIENIYVRVVAHSGLVTAFKHGYNSSFLACSRKILLSQS
jgi:hypothetical protein